MFRITQNSTAARAKSYFAAPDYYCSEGQEQELAGRWCGEAAARLGLAGKVDQKAWEALCDNRDPNTGRQLTVRRKQDRSVGYDFTFNCPKSVSLIYGLTQDSRILDAFRASVDETMREMESEMKTRVRRGGKNEDRTTANMAWGEFVHKTSRPVNETPDPHLHAHCFVFNVTFDANENRWKAGQFRELKRSAPFFEARFHTRLSRKMAELGLPVERTRHGWEISGLRNASLDKFSRRTTAIEKAAIEFQAKADEQWREELAKGNKAERKLINKYEVGAKTRERKQKNLTMAELQAEWQARLTGEEASGVTQVIAKVGGRSIPENTPRAHEATLLAADHCFERKSVVAERDLLTQAMKRSYGDASVESVERAMVKQNLIVREKEGRRFATTVPVLQEEQRMIAFARDGRGTSRHLGRGPHTFKRAWLNEGQRKAVQHVLDSSDRVILIRGGAGVGKTSMMLEAVEAIETGGTKVYTFAPSAEASRSTLRQEGFANAETVARLLADEKLQQEMKGCVAWIDEAGLMGAKMTAQIFDLAERCDLRLILSGDRRQHGSVERGAALRLLETEAGLLPADIRDIQRQKGVYKHAIEALSEGDTREGFEQLDKLGWIKEIADDDRHKVLARDYVAVIEKGKSALIVSPTHAEGEKITGEIRSALKDKSRLGSQEHEIAVLKSSNLTQAERADEVQYAPGDVLVFHQNAKGYTKGQRVVVGQEPIPVTHADKFQNFHSSTMAIASGDLLRVTKNGKTADGLHRLNNGALYTVKTFTPDGDIVLNNGWTISKEFGHLDYGYVVTSHTSQSKTVDHVFIGQSADSFVASSREQFYVSASRGRHSARIYTDSKQALVEAVSHSDDRLTATELLFDQDHRLSTIQRSAQRDNREIDARRAAARNGNQQKGLDYER